MHQFFNTVDRSAARNKFICLCISFGKNVEHFLNDSGVGAAQLEQKVSKSPDCCEFLPRQYDLSAAECFLPSTDVCCQVCLKSVDYSANIITGIFSFILALDISAKWFLKLSNSLYISRNSNPQKYTLNTQLNKHDYSLHL